MSRSTGRKLFWFQQNRQKQTSNNK